MILRGTKSSIVAKFGDFVKMYIDGEEWKDIPAPSLTDGNLNAPDHFVNGITQNESFIDPASFSNNLETQAILEAGLLSLREDRTVKLKEILP